MKTERPTSPIAPERPAPSRTPERESLKGRVITEAEWLNPGLGRPKAGDRS
jgi:hypothetical protein